jgi:hypothetical protein
MMCDQIPQGVALGWVNWGPFGAKNVARTNATMNSCLASADLTTAAASAEMEIDKPGTEMDRVALGWLAA